MKSTISFTLAILTSALSAQDFSGKIDFRYATQNDTTINTYLVQDKMVRLDQFNKKTKSVEGSFLFDIQANTVQFLSARRKVYGTQKREVTPAMKGTCEVTKGTGTKVIAGVKCTQYIVKNPTENTVIFYWIADGNYSFFAPLLQMWNRPDKQSIYFAQIKDLPAGSMPFLSEEKQISTGKLLTKLEVLKIEKGPQEKALFEIPAGYTKMDQ